MIRRPPRSTRTDTLFPYTTLFRSYSEQVNNEEYIIRGIGKANEDLATDAGVAIYLNGAYLPQSGESNAALFDIERVEVLRGPQGTLYGKNAVGGVVNIITRQPTNQLDGRSEERRVGKEGFSTCSSRGS